MHDGSTNKTGEKDDNLNWVAVKNEMSLAHLMCVCVCA